MDNIERRKPGPQHSDETIELAFEVWAFKASQNCRRTARILASDEYGSITVTDESIRYWRDTRDWGNRLIQSVRQIAPGLSMQAVIDQMAGGPEALALLRRAVAGDIPGIQPKDMISAAVALADRSGFSPLGRMNRPALGGAAPLPSLADMTPAQALQHERDLIELALGAGE